VSKFSVGTGCAPPRDMHDAIEGPDVEQPRRKIDVEEAIRVAETMRRTLPCSAQSLFRTRKLDVREPTRCCVFSSVTLLKWEGKGKKRNSTDMRALRQHNQAGSRSL
jgi:hypothetical protein